MLDLLGIMVSSIMMLIIVVRGIKLDRTQPWFQAVVLDKDKMINQPRKWQRRN